MGNLFLSILLFFDLNKMSYYYLAIILPILCKWYYANNLSNFRVLSKLAANSSLIWFWWLSLWVKTLQFQALRKCLKLNELKKYGGMGGSHLHPSVINWLWHECWNLRSKFQLHCIIPDLLCKLNVYLLHGRISYDGGEYHCR